MPVVNHATANTRLSVLQHQTLIRLLCAWQDSLGGNAKTSLVVAVTDAAESMNETLDSLNFGGAQSMMSPLKTSRYCIQAESRMGALDH